MLLNRTLKMIRMVNFMLCIFCGCSLTQSCPALFDPMDCSTPGLLVPHCLLCPSSCPLHWWCRPAISSSDALFSFCPQSFKASGTFPMSRLFVSDDQNIGASVSASVLSMSIQGWFPLRLTDLTLLSKGCSRVFSSTTVRRYWFFGILPSLQTSSHNHSWPLGRPKPWLCRPLSEE